MTAFYRATVAALALILALAASTAEARQIVRKIQADPGGARSQLGKSAPQQLDAIAFQQQIANMQKQIEADTQAIATLQTQVKSQASEIITLQHPVPATVCWSTRHRSVISRATT